MVVNPRLLTMLVTPSDTRFSGLDQDDLVGALGFASYSAVPGS